MRRVFRIALSPLLIGSLTGLALVMYRYEYVRNQSLVGHTYKQRLLEHLGRDAVLAGLIGLLAGIVVEYSATYLWHVAPDRTKARFIQALRFVAACATLRKFSTRVRVAALCVVIVLIAGTLARAEYHVHQRASMRGRIEASGGLLWSGYGRRVVKIRDGDPSRRISWLRIGLGDRYEFGIIFPRQPSIGDMEAASWFPEAEVFVDVSEGSGKETDGLEPPFQRILKEEIEGQ